MIAQSFIIFSMSEVNIIDFSEVLETSENTLRKSLDGTKSFVKYDGLMPTSISSLTTKEGPYTQSQMVSILSGSDWSGGLD